MVEAVDEKPLPLLLVPALRQILVELTPSAKVGHAAQAALRALKSFANGLKLAYGDFEMSLDVDPAPGVADSGDLESDLRALLVAVGEAAVERRTGVAILIDELQYLQSKELSALIMGLHRIAQLNLPVVLFGAGLPQVVGNAGRSKSYAERLFEFPSIGPLSPADAAHAVQDPVKHSGAEFTKDALADIVRLTEGYPYFLQEWGYQSWNLAEHSQIDREVVAVAGRRAVARLDQNFFRVRFDRLTPKERDYLRAMSELGEGPQRSGDIAKLLAISSQQAGPVRDSLIGKGMIYSPQYGLTAFTVPLFDRFMKRSTPMPLPLKSPVRRKGPGR